jgi:thioredoxin 1
MAAVTITQQNYEEEVLRSDRTVLLDFWASWCGPCRMVSPILDEIAQERPDVKVCKLNVDDQRDLAMQCGISSIPTLMVFKDGKLVRQNVGAIPKEQILAML